MTLVPFSGHLLSMSPLYANTVQTLGCVANDLLCIKNALKTV